MRPNLSIFEERIVWYDKVAYLQRNKKMSEEYPFEIENKAFESYTSYLHEPNHIYMSLIERQAKAETRVRYIFTT